MLILVTYDVNTQDKGGQARLRRVAKICLDYGVRVQNSVFECIVDNSQFLMLKRDIREVIDEEKDSLRFYNLGNSHKTKVEHIGIKPSLDVEGTMIF